MYKVLSTCVVNVYSRWRNDRVSASERSNTIDRNESLSTYNNEWNSDSYQLLHFKGTSPSTVHVYEASD